MKTRIISAIIMAAILIPVLIFGGLPFKFFIIALCIISMYELIKVRQTERKIPFVLQMISYLFITGLIYFSNDKFSVGYTLDYRVFVTVFLVFLFPIVFINDNSKYNINDALYLIGGILFLAISFNTFIIIRNIDITNLIYLALITMLTDTFALFSGKLVGKHKLCEKISPNKTIEGAIGGLIIGTVISVLFYVFVINPSVNILVLTLITTLLSVVGQIGDLVFSSIKRYYKIKDFSNIIPGHGGIMDRMDSFLFIIITYMLFMNIL